MLAFIGVDHARAILLFIACDAYRKSTDSLREFNFDRTITERKEMRTFDVFFAKNSVDDLFLGKTSTRCGPINVFSKIELKPEQFGFKSHIRFGSTAQN